MKPEHFIYKSNDLYYMQNVPDRPVLSCGVEATESNCPLEYCRCYKKTIAYNEALERAKAEAGKCDIKLEVKAVASAMVQGVITSDKDWIEGQIYTINMEEKIEVFEEPEFPGFDHTSYPTFRNIARIAAPKKEEEEKRFKRPTPEEGI